MLPLVAGAVVLTDQFTKTLAVDHLGPGAHHVFGPFGFELAYNSGSAFSLLQGGSWPLFAFGVVLVIALSWMALRATSLLLEVALSLIIGGALGNMVDRVARGHDGSVVDFITLSHWPTFNLGDACIAVGAILVIVSLLFGRDDREAPQAPGASS